MGNTHSAKNDVFLHNPLCGICQEYVMSLFDEEKVSKCGHVFHSECIDLYEFRCVWREEAFECPSCEKMIELIEKE